MVHCILLLVLICLSLLCYSRVDAVNGAEWTGTFTTVGWLDNIKVCSTISPTTTDKYHVQGLANKIVYLRGTSICKAYPCAWDGRFYYQGREAIIGTFNFVINANGITGNVSFDGGFALKNIPITGSRISPARPATNECFESEPAFIESKQPQFTGYAAKSQTVFSNRAVISGSYLMISYQYMYVTERIAPGQIYGPCYENGQVCTVTWYESLEPSQGIEVFVGINSTTTFSSWNTAPTLSLFNLSYDYSVDEGAIDMRTKFPGTEVSAALRANDYVCTSLSTVEEEESCATQYSSCDCPEPKTQLIEVAVAFAILAFIFSFAVAVKVLIFSGGISTPLLSTNAKSSSSL